MIASKQSPNCLSNRWGIILIVATGGFSLCGCCAGLSRHHRVTCYECACASHGSLTQQAQPSAPMAASIGPSQSTSPTAFVSPSSILDSTDDVTPVPPIESSPAQAEASELEIPFATPSNTLITEINDEALPNPKSNEQSLGNPDQAIPKLKTSVDSDFSAALLMNGRDDSQAGDNNTPRILFAVPPLRPTNIPPIVRFLKIEDSTIANTQRQIYSLTATPVLPGARVLPIDPVLEGLRIGRPITPSPTVDTLRR